MYKCTVQRGIYKKKKGLKAASYRSYRMWVGRAHTIAMPPYLHLLSMKHIQGITKIELDVAEEVVNKAFNAYMKTQPSIKVSFKG